MRATFWGTDQDQWSTVFIWAAFCNFSSRFDGVPVLGTGPNVMAAIPTDGVYEIRAEVTDSGAPTATPETGSESVNVGIDSLAGFEARFTFEADGVSNYTPTSVDWLKPCAGGFEYTFTLPVTGETGLRCGDLVEFCASQAVGLDPEPVIEPDGIADGIVDPFGFEGSCGFSAAEGNYVAQEWGDIRISSPLILNACKLKIAGEEILDVPVPAFTGSGTVRTVWDNGRWSLDISLTVDPGEFSTADHSGGSTSGTAELYLDGAGQIEGWAAVLDIDVGGAVGTFQWNTTSQARTIAGITMFRESLIMALVGDFGLSGSGAATVGGPWTLDIDPVADAGGPYAVNGGGSVAPDGSGSMDPGGSLVAWAWDLDNDGAYDDATGASPSFSAAGQECIGIINHLFRHSD